MRQRRNKRVRKAVSFYKVCYQFREPFKVRSQYHVIIFYIEDMSKKRREQPSRMLGSGTTGNCQS